MKKRPYKSKSFLGKCWYLADELIKQSENVRNANKPADLLYPHHQFLQILRRLSVLQDEWLRHWLKEKNDSKANWPKLWDRYH